MDGWKLIPLFDIQIMSSEKQIMSKTRQRESKINIEMDLQGEIRIALTEKKTTT